MFHLSDATRRQTAMGLFILLCVVPTLVVVAIGLWRCLPGRIAAEERRLTLLFGQPVRIEVVGHPKPGTTLYEGLELLDPETGEVLLRCDRLRARFESVRDKGEQDCHRQLSISAGKITLTASSTDRFRPMVTRLLQRRIEGAPTHVELAAQKLVLHNGHSDFSTRQVRGRARLCPQDSRLEVNLQMEDQPDPVYLCLVRNREYQPAVEGFELKTVTSLLPCSLLATIMPPFPELGPDSRFQGRIVGSHVPEGCQMNGQKIGPEGWQLNLEGNLLDIELRKLVSDHIPHAISGIGSLQLKDVEIRAGRISRMRGTLHATGGGVSRALVASCIRDLGLKGTLPVSGSSALWPYDRLAFGFALDGSGLTLAGMCPSEPDEGAILVGKYNLRLVGPVPTFGPVPFTKAVAAVTSTPENHLIIPHYGSRLMQRLPVIPASSTLTIAGQSTSAPW